MKGVSGIQKISVYDPVTGTVVQLNNVSTEGDFQKGVFESENTKGQILYGGDDSFFECLAFEHTGFTQLETWMKAETLVRLVVLGLEQHILWYESSKITVEKSYPVGVGSRTGFKLRIQTKGGVHNILVGSNLLYMVNGWQDAVAPANQADNYDIVGSMTASTFSSGVQRLITTGAQTGLMFDPALLIFPIAGAKLQLSVRVDQVLNGAALNIEAELWNFTTKQSDENALLSVGLVEFTTAASFYKLHAQILEGGSSDSLTADIAYPYLGVQLGAHEDINY